METRPPYPGMGYPGPPYPGVPWGVLGGYPGGPWGGTPLPWSGTPLPWSGTPLPYPGYPPTLVRDPPTLAWVPPLPWVPPWGVLGVPPYPGLGDPPTHDPWGGPLRKAKSVRTLRGSWDFAFRHASGGSLESGDLSRPATGTLWNCGRSVFALQTMIIS